MSKTAKIETPAASLPEMIYSPMSVGMSDQHALSALGLYRALRAVDDMPLPQAVVDSVTAYQRLRSWRTPVDDLPTAQAAHVAELVAAAKVGADRPSPDRLSRAALNAGVLRVIGVALGQAEVELYGQLVRSVHAGLDEIVGALTEEHDRLLGVLREQADRLPVSVRSAEAAIASDVADEWKTATLAATRIFKVRDARCRAARCDGVRGRDEDYAIFMSPDDVPPPDPDVTVRGLGLIVNPGEPWCPSRTELQQRLESIAEERKLSRIGVKPAARKANVPLPGKVATA